jgi:hypothetical protein
MPSPLDWIEPLMSVVLLEDSQTAVIAIEDDSSLYPAKVDLTTGRHSDSRPGNGLCRNWPAEVLWRCHWRR